MNPLLLTDFYKVGHPFQYPDNTELVYSNFTPRKSRIKQIDSMVFFGLQYFIKEYLIKRFNENFFDKPKEEVLKSYKRIVKNSLGSDLPSYAHVEALHDLGYLPIKIKALPEGSLVPMGVPGLTIVNTKKGPNYSWITNWVESLMSSIIWSPSTSATIAFEYRKQQNKWAELTGMPAEFVQWQCHDFSFRGMSSLESAMTSGMGHLLSFTGTDTIPAIMGFEEYYNADSDKELIGGSVAATEHSVMCAGGNETEIETFRRLITKVQPNGIISVVSDTWDLWKVLTTMSLELKPEIMTRDGKVVYRPDSGNPVDIICGTVEYEKIDPSWEFDVIGEMLRRRIVDRVAEETPHGERGDESPYAYFKYDDKTYQVTISIDWNRYDKQYYYIDGDSVESVEEVQLSNSEKGAIELLWETFGGTVNEKGFKVLDSHVGLIYGDGITLERQESINKRLMEKGFAAQVVFGVGSFSYQRNSRDEFGSAMKATYVEIDGVGKEIFKDPITDSGMKKSAKGLLQVKKVNNEYVLKDQCTWAEEQDSELQTVFENGKLIKDYTLSEIRKTLGTF